MGEREAKLAPRERTIKPKALALGFCHISLPSARLFRAIYHGKPPVGEQTLQAPGLKL
jgi:hypothetical protein